MDEISYMTILEQEVFDVKDPVCSGLYDKHALFHPTDAQVGACGSQDYQVTLALYSSVYTVYCRIYT